MKIQIKRKVLALFTSTIMLTLSCFISGYSNNIIWEPIPNNETENTNSDVANQEMTTVYGQAISSADYYNMKDDYDNEIEELKAQVEKLQKENEELKAENDELKLYAELSDAEWTALYRVARAEAGAVSAEGQSNVVYVVLNRVKSSKFPDNIEEVIKDSGQFECVSNNSYYRVELSDTLKANVRQAYYNYRINNENAQGALYFCKGTFSGLTYLFTDEVGHSYFK